MELASADLLTELGLFESVSPVDTHESDHREEDADADAGRGLEFEGIHAVDICPGVTGFGKGEGVDGSGGFEHKGIAEFEREARIGVGVVARAGEVTCDRSVFVTAESDDVVGVGRGVAAHAVTAHVVGFERRLAILVVGSEDAEVGARHQDGAVLEAGTERRIGAEFQAPLVVFDPPILLLCFSLIVRAVGVVGESLVVFTVEERIGRREGEGEGEIGTASGEEGAVGGRTREGEREIDVVAVAVADEEVIPVLQVVAGVAQCGHEGEVVVGPAQAFTETDVDTEELDVLIGIEVARVVVVVLRRTITIQAAVKIAVVGIVARGDVTLSGVEERDGELVGPLSAEPGIDELKRVALVVARVGLRGELQRLCIALGQESGALVAVAAEEVLHREVGELQAGSSDDARLSPSGRNLNLVSAFGDEGISDVDGAGGFVGTDIFVEFALEHFRVELVHGGEFTHRAREGIHGEEVAGLGAEFASDDVIVNTVVAGNANAVVGGLLAFAHANFEIDAVFVDLDFDGIGAEEDVTVVVILVADGIFVGVESLVEQRLVVDVALFHAQGGFECLRGVDGVAHPGDVAQVVARSLVEFEVNIDVLVVIGHDAVGHDHGVAIAPTVHFFDEQPLVFFVFVGEEFARSEGDPLFEGGAVAGFLHRIFEGRDHFGVDARDVDFVDGDFVAFVHIDVYNHAIIGRDILPLCDVDLDILVALLFEILLYAQFGPIHEVGRDLVAGFERNARFDLLALRLFESGESHFRDAGLGGELDVEIDFVSDDAVGQDLHVGEEPLLPVVLNSGADFVARHLVGFAHFEVGNADEQIFVVALDAVDLDAPEHVACGLCGVDDVGLGLRLRTHRRDESGSAEEA